MKFFIDNSRLVILITLGLIFLGIRGLSNLKREAIPPVDFATAIITTFYPGSSAKEVEELITKKIEDEIRAVPHLKDVNSVSMPGFSQITIRIDMDNTNTKEVINELHQNLQNVQGLPPEVLDPPKLLYIDSARENPILNLYLAGPDGNRTRDKYSWELKNNIENLSGVLKVDLGNYKKREFSINLSTEKMNRYHISSSEVLLALQTQKFDIPAGYLESTKNRHLTKLIGKFRTVKDLKNIIVRSNFSGNKIRIKDIGTVKDHFEKETEKHYIYNSSKDPDFKLQPSVSIAVFKNLSADLIDLIDQIKQDLKPFKKNLNPSYDIFFGYDESQATKKRLRSVINNALIGLLLIFIVFFLFLPARLSLMAGLSLPLTILSVFCFLPYMGVSFNVVTMLAFVICIGMLVDNSVVIAEYYTRLSLDQNLSPKQASLQTVQQFFKPITATVLTTIVAFLPLLITSGVMGEFTKWIPIVVSLSLLMSLFESFCLLPNRLQWITQKKHSSYQKGIFNYVNRLEKGFEFLLSRFVVKKYLTSLGILILIVSSFMLLKFGVKMDLFSNRSPEFYTASITAQPNQNLEQMDQQVKNISYEIQKVFEGEKNIDWMTVHINPEVSRILLQVKSSVLRKLKYKNLLEELRKIEKGDFIKELEFNILGGGPPVGKALNVALLSNDRKKIREFIQKIYPQIANLKGLVDLQINPDTNKGTEYKAFIKPEDMARLGVDFQSVGIALRTALEGTLITEITENNESFYIRVKHNQEETSSIKDLNQIQIKERMGRQISLGQVADVLSVPADPDRKSYNFSPVVFISANVDPKKTTSLKVNNQVRKIISKEIKKHPAVKYKLIGEQETTKESFESLLKAAVIAFFCILIILVALFKSFVLSFLILSCIPLGLIGVIWSFFLHGRSLNFFAMIGVVGLAGVVVNSAIILISFILKLQKEQPNTPLKDIVIKASKIRFKPILITNLTTLGGLFPTAYGFPSFEPLLMPMTLALFWGLVTATALTLVWVPCAFLMIEEFKQLFKSLKNKYLRL